MDLLNKIISLFILVFFIKPELPAQEKDSFVLVHGGEYRVGAKDNPVNPVRKVKSGDYLIARFETTNRQFAAFILATAYVTDAERRHNAMVFKPGLKEFRWMNDTTAYWRFPNGISRGGIENKMNHPVTCISYADILAYCNWAGVRLPTLDEWEVASRAGTTTRYYFGDDDKDLNQYANIWHGHDHLTADSSDGYMYTAPVGSFKPNAWGLYDMYGNVFEFCSDRTLTNKSKTVANARGGSWWCSRSSCHYFNSSDIGRVNIHASFSNQGFRVAKSSDKKDIAIKEAN